MKTDLIVGLAAAAGITILAFKVSEGVNSVLSSTGAGINEALGGAGSALAFSGMGVKAIGEGAGSALSSVGEGFEEIGRGIGYATSGANLQDLLQTVLTLGKGEASTYNQNSLGSLGSIPTASGSMGEASTCNQNSQGSLGSIPTASGSMGLAAFIFSPLSAISSFVTSIRKPKASVSTTEALTTPSGENKLSSALGVVRTSALGTTQSSGGGSSGSSSLKNSKAPLAQRNILLEAAGYTGTSTSLGVTYSAPKSSSLKSSKAPTTKKWFNPFSWF